MEPYYEHAGVTIYHGDCREIAPALSRVDSVVTDPPYMFGMASTGHEGKSGGWGDMMNAAGIYAEWLKCWKVLLQNSDGAAWVFNSWRSLPVLARAAYDAAWPIESLMVWDKEWIGPGGANGLRPSYEVVALFRAGEYRVADRGMSDIIRCKWAGAKRWHAAEKPVELLSRLISAGGIPSRVLDPFCGSGSTLIAARSLGVEAIGIEIEERYCEIAAKRLAQEVLPF